MTRCCDVFKANPNTRPFSEYIINMELSSFNQEASSVQSLNAAEILFNVHFSAAVLSTI